MEKLNWKWMLALGVVVVIGLLAITEPKATNDVIQEVTGIEELLPIPAEDEVGETPNDIINNQLGR